MSATYHQIPSLVYQRDVLPQPITSLSFDPVTDILWSGTNSGHVCANYTARGLRGVHYPVGGHLAVKKILATESNVIACGVASDGIGAWGKGGLNAWFFRPGNQITTFSNKPSNGSTIALSTASSELILLNTQTGSVLRRSSVPSILTHLHFTASQTYFVSGDADGWVRLHDPRDATTRSYGSNMVKAHLSGIQGIETTSTLLYTIGLGMRQGRPFPDPLVKVYDLRNLKALTPIPFSQGPSFITRFANRPSTLAITSSQGLVQIVDTTNPATNEFYQLDAPSYISSVAVSPTAGYMAFGDSDGAIHLLSAAEEEAMLPFNGFDGKPIEWPDSAEALLDITWTDTTTAQSLNTVGMPHYKSLLLSSWSTDFAPTNMYFAPPPKIPQQVLSSIKVNDSIAYASLPKELRGRRNVVATAPRKSGGRFRSGKTRYNESEPVTPTHEYNPDIVPKCYRKVEIEYSKFGVEDFDFGHVRRTQFYNKTSFSGLETHILNSYTNALVQVMHYTLPIRRLAKSHITTDCPREHCLLCELGFVTRMLEDAHGTNCQSSNFCKTVGVLAQMNNAIELMDYGRESAELSYAHMIQMFHRFLIDHLSSEGNSFPHNPMLLPNAGPIDMLSPAPAPITQLLGVDAKNIIVCATCHAVREKENMTHLIDLIYPVRRAPDAVGEADFASTTHKATCQTCKQFSTFETRRAIHSRDLPPILAVNAAAHGEEAHKFWRDSRRQTFLRPRVQIHGQIDGMDDPEAVVVPKDANSHLVAIIKAVVIFNDFVVQNISEDEALSFPSGGRSVPAILYLERVDMDRSILCRDTNIAANRDSRVIKHEPLRFEELPKPGTLIAIDAEFVSMQQEETEYRSDGTKKVIRPARLSLARVSVLRGDGSKEGMPFIDDHIHTSEIIVDYLTEFSGIKFGDLDPSLSRYTLTPLKVVYKKLRLLVDSGCILSGTAYRRTSASSVHIFVPQEQVIDTVDLYFLEARQRRLSLKFLTWFVLKENIQTDTHDSIEDALSALKLYKLEEVYREGKQYVSLSAPRNPKSINTDLRHDPRALSPRPQPMGRGGFLSGPRGATQFNNHGHYPLQAVATPPIFPIPGPNHHPHGFMQPNWRHR
ncbi:ubiquitin carboxyl-terminal hydrolase-domain-containing protein [Epithele typhae]|uniref:ubiquitin carboxyl-terminal hydrolase-domain-containing protein n=1 Tax=Epithele typhae TaxID=378194 RepID=UPI002008169E|nr:ubiquitin carboxyl-terminal hydrolase-domain-containing protein [Epithele typhae]KAH9923912.1 ubiquitin carboxyl-terminal hydrolase-domain-containing protein [Epithele typhae]